MADNLNNETDRIVEVREPIATELNRALNSLRAQLFELVEVGMQPYQHDGAKRRIRETTLASFNEVRRTVNRILEPTK